MPKSTMNINSDPMHITALECLISRHTQFSSTGEACSGELRRKKRKLGKGFFRKLNTLQSCQAMLCK